MYASNPQLINTESMEAAARLLSEIADDAAGLSDHPYTHKTGLLTSKVQWFGGDQIAS